MCAAYPDMRSLRISAIQPVRSYYPRRGTDV